MQLTWEREGERRNPVFVFIIKGTIHIPFKTNNTSLETLVAKIVNADTTLQERFPKVDKMVLYCELLEITSQ